MEMISAFREVGGGSKELFERGLDSERAASINQVRLYPTSASF
jgi:hypothetical protein